MNSINRESILRLKKKKETLKTHISEIRRGFLQFLFRSNEKLEFLSRSVQNLSPEEVLKRGYSMTLLNGKSIRSADNLKKGDKITTRVHRGRIESEVFEIRK